MPLFLQAKHGFISPVILIHKTPMYG